METVTFDPKEEQRLLAEWFDTTQFDDNTKPGAIPPMSPDPDDDDNESSRR